MGRIAPLLVAGALCGCSNLATLKANTTPGVAIGMFIEGDIANAEAIAAAAQLPQMQQCLPALAAVAMQTPIPANDGLITLLVREAALEAAVRGQCGPVISPLLLKAIGKLVPAPFGIGLPF